MEITLLVTLLICFMEELAGHGLMQSPPARNYMWRLGFDTERNYNDMGLNCGGFSVNISSFYFFLQMRGVFIGVRNN